jgi:molecular chaperone DnaK
MSYGLGVDLGTTCTAAAVSDASGTRTISLGQRITVSSVVVAAEDGTLRTGDAAERVAAEQPLRASHNHKRRLGDPTPLTLDGVVRSPASLMAAQLRDVVAMATAAMGTEPGAVVLTCPAVWGPYRREHFEEVPRLAGLRGVRIITEPEAAAMHYSVERRLGDGELVAVYDLGGGTFDATVLRARPHGMEILGTPEGIEHMGGIDFDESMFAHVDSLLDGAVTELDPTDPDHARTLAAVRESCRGAKEALSTEPDVTLHVPLPDGPRELLVTRLEFNEWIRPHLQLTTEALSRTIASAGLRTDDLAGVLLAGGSSRIPLVAQVVSQAFGKPVRVGLHPKLTVALGAAAVARAEVARARTASPRPASPAPSPAAAQLAPPEVAHHGRPAPVSSTTGIVPPIVFAPGPPAAARNATATVRTKPRTRLFTAAAVVALLVVAGVSATVAMNSGSSASPLSNPVAGMSSVGNPPPSAKAFFQDGHEVGPYKSLIGSTENWGGTMLTPDGAASQTAIHVVPSDVNTKGDGRRVTWTGASLAQFYVQHPGGREDARPYVDTGVLTFDVIVHEPPTANTTLAMHCHYPCAGQLDATSLFRELPTGQKTTVHVPIACFTDQGLDPATVDTPFLVATEGRFEASFANISWQAGGEDATACSSLG